ncbi:MAG: DUF4440 domain-containing protein [Myxococcota bacterium]
MNKTLLTVSLFALVAIGCTPRRIPGTDLEDTEETRAILDVMEKYRAAVEARDAPGVLALVSESFADNAGTPALDDDRDFKRLREELPQDLSRVNDVRLEITVRKVEVSDTSARAIYTYSSSFRMPGLVSKPQNDSEIKEMTFLRVGDTWKITSGI